MEINFSSKNALVTGAGKGKVWKMDAAFVILGKLGGPGLGCSFIV